MKFRITPHRTAGPPEQAIELLSERLNGRREDVMFARVGTELRANVDRDEPVSMTSDERREIGRRAVLEIIGEVCERTPALKFDWYAVSAAR
ncbi:MAG TPA: hypothetical protein VH025_06105, partial [Solirubrobacteraceae bacterium]|nr:hypothetical protein [Solirubrobacteraceae bacterium]